jgi:hypothetical protein
MIHYLIMEWLLLGILLGWIKLMEVSGLILEKMLYIKKVQFENKILKNIIISLVLN